MRQDTKLETIQGPCNIKKMQADVEAPGGRSPETALRRAMDDGMRCTQVR
jgi:hypothetical protein